MTATRQGVLLGLGVAVAAYLLSFFHRVAPAAISGDLQSAFAIGGAQLGTLAATYFYVYTLMQIPTGVLSDTLGPRRSAAITVQVSGIHITRTVGVLFYNDLLIAKSGLGGGGEGVQGN